MSRVACPHGCGANLTDAHVRDTGDDAPVDACPVLVERRRASIAVAVERRAPGLLTLPEGYRSGITDGHGHKR